MHKRLTAVALRFSGRSVSALAAAASSPLPLKHDTGFECDRLMIGCSALSPASLGVIYRSARAEEAGNYGYGYLHLPFPGTLNECIFTTEF